MIDTSLMRRRCSATTGNRFGNEHYRETIVDSTVALQFQKTRRLELFPRLVCSIRGACEGIEI